MRSAGLIRGYAGCIATALLLCASPAAAGPDLGGYIQAGMAARITALEKHIAILEGELKDAVAKQDQLVAATGAISDEAQYKMVGGFSSCPSGWNRIGTVGIILANGDVSKTKGLQIGAPLNSNWTWIHPVLCEHHGPYNPHYYDDGH